MINKLLKKDKSLKGNIYVVQGGTYGGDYLVLVEESILKYNFLVLPDKLKRIIEKEDFERGIKNKVVKLIEKLPNYVFEVCKKEFDSINNNE